MNRNEIKQKINQLAETSKENLIVLDLDSTLYNVSSRTQAILHHLGRDDEFSKLYPSSAKALLEVEIRHTDWGVKEALIRSEIKESLDFFDRIRSHWVKYFFSNHFLKFDVPYSGAVDFVQKLHDMGFSILYLTGRSHSSMLEGTKESLKNCGFPESHNENIRLKLRPDHFIKDEEFKSTVLDSEVENFKSIWLIDNEPVILNKVAMTHPTVQRVYFKSVHSKRDEEPTDVLVLDNSFPEL